MHGKQLCVPYKLWSLWIPPFCTLQETLEIVVLSVDIIACTVLYVFKYF